MSDDFGRILNGETARLGPAVALKCRWECIQGMMEPIIGGAAAEQVDRIPASLSAADARYAEVNSPAFTRSAFPLDFQAPPPFDARRFTDPIDRNQAITSWYREMDTAMRCYLGNPPLPSWATFGQHASHSAGLEMRSLVEAITTFNEMKEAFDAFKAGSPFRPSSWVKFFKEASDATREIGHLFLKDGAISKGIGLAFCKIAHPMRELIEKCDTWKEFREILTSKEDFGELVRRGKQFIGALIDLPARVQQATETMLNVMITGNTEIFEAMAPNLSGFLEAASRGEEMKYLAKPLPGDPRGFMSAALLLYSEVRNLSLRAEEYGASSDDYQKLQDRRVALIKRANILMVFGEQAVRVQPLYDCIREELGVMSGKMSIIDPSGIYPLLPKHPSGNWADLYTRMGIDPAFAPKDPREITPEDFPPLLPSHDCRFRGTIAEYFLRPFVE